MGRVEWATLSGDEVETLLSNLLYNRYENALRIRPAQGDYGIDVVVPDPGEQRQWDVYQVKKFASNLDSNQKKQIEGSFRRVLLALVRGMVPMRNWYLVTPLDPTLPNLQDWFEGLPTRAVDDLRKDTDVNLTADEHTKIITWLEEPDRVTWKGLNFCEGLAADFPYVIDYYLHGGRDRLRDAVADVAALLHTDLSLRIERPPDVSQASAALVTPGDVQEHLLRLDRVLDTDPHYRYGISLDLNRPGLTPEPRLVAAQQMSVHGERWLTVKIYERSAQSLDERPIPLELQVHVDAPDAREAFEAWLKYGKPTEVTATFSMDLPGGLDTAATLGRVRLSPTDEDSQPHKMRLRIVDPAGAALGELAFTMTSSSGQSGSGLWASGMDTSGTLSTESLFDLTDQTSKITFTLEPLAGREASKAAAAVAFASHLAAPNELQVAAEYGPFLPLSPVTTPHPLTEPAVARFVAALATLQQVTAVPIIIPDIAEMPDADRAAVRHAAALINGQTLMGTWEQFEVAKTSEMPLAPAIRYDFRVQQPLHVNLNGTTVTLGSAVHEVTEAVIADTSEKHIRVVPGDNNTSRTTFSPDKPDGRHLVQARPSAPRKAQTPDQVEQ